MLGCRANCTGAVGVVGVPGERRRILGGSEIEAEAEAWVPVVVVVVQDSNYSAEEVAEGTAVAGSRSVAVDSTVVVLEFAMGEMEL